MSISPSVISNVVIASVFAFSIAFFLLLPAIGRIMLPFYKKGDSSQVGFVRMGDALRTYRGFIPEASSKFIIPVFATAYIYFLIVLEFYSSPSPTTDQSDLYFMLGLWALVMLITGPTTLMVITIAIPFFIGYILSGSIYWGCFAVALILAISFAYSYEDVFVYKLASNRVELETKMHLDGTRSRLVKIYASRIFRVLTPIFMTITILAMVLRSGIVGITTTNFEVPSTNLLLTIPLLIVFTNMSVRIFSGGLYKYLQVDFLTLLGELLRFSQENPEDFAKFDSHVQEGTNDLVHKGILLNSTDRIPSFSKASTPKFRAALSFYSLDALLTLSTVLGISIVPGLTPENVATISYTIKIPLYVVFLLRSNFRFLVWLKNRFNVETVTASVTYQEEVRDENRFTDSLERLLHSILKQQISQKGYIDASENTYLLSLAGERHDSDERIHI